VRVVVLVLVWCCGTAVADPCPSLAREVRRADRWNLAWRLIYSTTTVGEAAIALTPLLDRDMRRAAAVGAAQSFIGAAGAWVMPLRLDRDGCDLDKAATVERRTFWLLHAGNLVVNIGGTVALAELTSWRNAAPGFAIGYAVGLVQIYTLPRLPAGVAVTPVAGGWSVNVAGTF
jgi:hypothetical protein